MTITTKPEARITDQSTTRIISTSTTTITNSQTKNNDSRTRIRTRAGIPMSSGARASRRRAFHGA